MEAADRMMALVQSVPAIGQAGADMIVKALDMPYGEKLADRLAMMLLPPGVDADIDKKRMEARAQMGPQQPDPMQQIALATATEELKNTAADTALKSAKAEREQVATVIDQHQAHLKAFETGVRMVS
jgi:hypothetical protein